ncbi:MAG: hypothetical protein H0U23_03295, partial [Blastocatellia bacterium]|nr:hypothetical protein [Blastocatellia bacterium]
MKKIIVTAVLIAFAPLGAFAQSALWQNANEKSITVRAPRHIVPKAYRTVHLDQGALTQVLAQAPMEFTEEANKSAVVMSIPMPDGTLARFRIQESPISAPDPSGRVSTFRSYSGQGLDDPTATMRCDISPAGFHAQILSAGETVYVDPYAMNDLTNCISYYRRDAQRAGARPECFALPESFHLPRSLPTKPGLSQPNAAHGSMLSTVRSAFAATAEYTTFFRQGGDTDDQAKARALDAIKVT